MHRVKLLFLACLGLGTVALIAEQSSATPPAPQAGSPPGSAQAPAQSQPAVPEFLRVPAYPTRPPADPADIAHGKQIFSANCSFCHGSDARGGEQGPNLIRSELVLNDKNGELIAQVVQNGRVDRGMPKFDLTTGQVKTIADYIHSIPVGGRAATTGSVNPLVGDARAGEVYFNGAGKCTSCHSLTGDLAHIGARFTDVRALQGAFLSGERRGESADVPRKTVTVTLPGGQTVEGRLDQIDDFIVSLTDADGNYHSFPRMGDVPKVVVKNPLQPHLDMLRTFKDDDIHNLTAFLVTVK